MVRCLDVVCGDRGVDHAKIDDIGAMHFLVVTHEDRGPVTPALVERLQELVTDIVHAVGQHRLLSLVVEGKVDRAHDHPRAVGDDQQQREIDARHGARDEEIMIPTCREHGHGRDRDADRRRLQRPVGHEVDDGAVEAKC